MALSTNANAVIASAVVPVVLMSAGGLLVLALYNRLANIVARLRVLLREQVREEEFAGALLDEEIHRVLRRARLVRNALLCLISALALFGMCSLTEGVSQVWPMASWVALTAFLLGQILLVGGLLLALLELGQALRPVELEARQAEAMARVSSGEDGN